VPLVDSRDNGITATPVAPADQTYRQKVAQPTEGVVADDADMMFS
jgi:hypothetical protein